MVERRHDIEEQRPHDNRAGLMQLLQPRQLELEDLDSGSSDEEENAALQRIREAAILAAENYTGENSYEMAVNHLPGPRVRNMNCIERIGQENPTPTEAEKIFQPLEEARPPGFAFSVAAKADNQKFATMAVSDPNRYQDMHLDLCEERALLERQHAILKYFPADKKSAPKEKRRILRRLWLLNGMLEHGMAQELLEIIVAKYEKIDAVPDKYFQPELYCSQNLRN